MKPSVIFDRWIGANAARLEQETPAFRRLVAFVALELKMIEHSPKGVSPGTAQSITERLAGLKHALSVRNMTPPELNLPKIKVVRPWPPNPRSK